MSQLGFIFDLNKCVGCHACHIACSIENDLGYDFSWREINTYNPEQINSLPHYHLSLACNHCQEPVCLYQCPAKAISKNLETGIVIIDEAKCIGCKFCSWVCPFDAPKYSLFQNVMTKCTLCSHRIEENLEPACVSICPTDALNITSENEFINEIGIPGFPESEIRPSIKIEPLKPDQELPEQYTLPYSKDIIQNYSKNRPKLKKKISLAGDWTLIIFSFLISLLGGLLSTSLFSNYIVDPFVFLCVGLIGLGLSTLHLGKKFRAYRAIFNLKTSWLSREIFFFSLFMLFALISLLGFGKQIIGFTALTLGYIAAISADNVYHVVAKENKKFFHSAQVWLTMLFFICFFNQFLWGVYIFGFIKMTLYISDKFQNKTNFIIMYLRMTSFITSIFFLIQSNITYAIIFIILSELLDRIEFYSSLSITTPQNHMNMHIQKDIKQA